MNAHTLSYDALRQTFKEQTLFKDKVWRLSPEPWPLTEEQYDELLDIGQACLEFYRAQERLYRFAVEDRNLLRNRELKAPWVAEYLDRGKPDELIKHARHRLLERSHPLVIRPDLLLTGDGFALTEMDAVPGGIGLTAFLNSTYGSLFPDVIGADNSMSELFCRAISSQAKGIDNPVIAIVVSDEAGIYRPEFDWLARELRKKGHSVYSLHPDQVMPMGSTLCTPLDGNPVKIDIIYRFFELFDLRNVSTADMILKAVEQGEVCLTPPMRHFQEEKLSLALFHHHLLVDYWSENLGRKSLKLLKKIIPMTWIIDSVDLPPNAVLDAPYIRGRPIVCWAELAEASQKERNFILKVSGFHESAWGARSVVLGSDVSRAEWSNAIQKAVEGSDKLLYILQDYRKPLRKTHPVYSPEGEVQDMQGRLRLCPYYIVDGDQIQMPGALATFCPADKKIIHGMRDAAMVPCRVVSA